MQELIEGVRIDARDSLGLADKALGSTISTAILQSGPGRCVSRSGSGASTDGPSSMVNSMSCISLIMLLEFQVKCSVQFFVDLWA
jgi:hypothetical protein